MFLFLPFFTFAYGLSDKSESFSLFRSIRKHGSKVEQLPFEAMLAEVNYHKAPANAREALSYETVPIVFPEDDATEKDNFYRNFDSLLFNTIKTIKIDPPFIADSIIRTNEINNFTVLIQNQNPVLNYFHRKIYKKWERNQLKQQIKERYNI